MAQLARIAPAVIRSGRELTSKVSFPSDALFNKYLRPYKEFPPPLKPRVDPLSRTAHLGTLRERVALIRQSSVRSNSIVTRLFSASSRPYSGSRIGGNKKNALRESGTSGNRKKPPPVASSQRSKKPSLSARPTYYTANSKSSNKADQFRHPSLPRANEGSAQPKRSTKSSTKKSSAKKSSASSKGPLSSSRSPKRSTSSKRPVVRVFKALAGPKSAPAHRIMRKKPSKSPSAKVGMLARASQTQRSAAAKQARRPNGATARIVVSSKRQGSRYSEDRPKAVQNGAVRHQSPSTRYSEGSRSSASGGRSRRNDDSYGHSPQMRGDIIDSRPRFDSQHARPIRASHQRDNLPEIDRRSSSMSRGPPRRFSSNTNSGEANQRPPLSSSYSRYPSSFQSNRPAPDHNRYTSDKHHGGDHKNFTNSNRRGTEDFRQQRQHSSSSPYSPHSRFRNTSSTSSSRPPYNNDNNNRVRVSA